MKLFSYHRSSAAFRVRIALALKGVNYETVPRHLLRGEQRDPAYLALNPQGLVPALVDDDAVITQSLAIIEYLEEAHPQPPLLPRDATERAHVRALAQSIACDVHPLNNRRVLVYLAESLGQDEQRVKQWYHHWIAVGFEALETQVKRYSRDSKHCFGDAVTMADVYLVPQMYNARRFGCDLAAYPTLVGIDAYLSTVPAFAEAVPEKQVDAE